MNLFEQQRVCKHVRQIDNKSKSSMKLPYNRALFVFVFVFETPRLLQKILKYSNLA